MSKRVISKWGWTVWAGLTWLRIGTDRGEKESFD
jgi:hypothetical protein